MVQVVDRVGKRYGKGVVIKRVPNGGRPGARWQLRCDCGELYESQGIELSGGHGTHCGCARVEDLTGREFGRWKILRLGEKSRTGLTRWWVRCKCGTEAQRHATALKGGTTKSCGCWQDEMRSANTTKHGHARPGKVTMTYRIWNGMRNRCRNPKHADFRHYGGRGIKVCKRWREFENFLADMGECPKGMTLERIDNDVGYRKSNCRWATRQDQSRNRRDTVRLTKDGITRPLAEWAELLKIKAITIHMRLRRGCTHEEALRVGRLPRRQR